MIKQWNLNEPCLLWKLSSSQYEAVKCLLLSENQAMNILMSLNFLVKYHSNNIDDLIFLMVFMEHRVWCGGSTNI